MFLIRFLFIFFTFHCISQVHNLEKLPTLRIDEENLQTLLTNDGKKLILLDTSELKEWRLNSLNSKKPAVIKLNKNEYLYNYYAVQNNLLCPEGKRIINIDDIKKLSIFEYNKYNFKKNVNYIDIEGSCQSKEINYEINKDNILGLASNLTIKNPDDSKFQSVIFPSGNFLFYSFLYESNDFLPSRCIEDLNYNILFRSKEFSYIEIMPYVFDNLKNRIIKDINSFKTIDENKTFYFSSELIFDSKGKNISKLILDNSKQNQTLQQELFNIVSNWTEYPYFEDIKIKSTAPISIKLERLKDEKSKFTDLTKRIIELKLENLNEYNLFIDVMNLADKGFEFNFKTVNYRIEFNGYLENEPKTNLLNKVKGKGPVYSLLSVVPGLGQLKIKQQEGYRKLRLWHFSVPVGAIAIASKIYSNYYYSKFLSDLDGSNSRKYYKQANFSQKVFLSSLLAYSAMSLVDFTFTFGIGCKNKITQMKVNSLIRDLK